MPASQQVTFKDFLVGARPAYWPRRVLRFPLYFQATKPSFQLWIKRMNARKPEAKEKDVVKFFLAFSDGTQVGWPLDVTDLAVGDRKLFTSPPMLLAPSGDAKLGVDFEDYFQRRFHTLYAFYVSNESTLVFLILNAALGGLIAIPLAALRLT